MSVGVIGLEQTLEKSKVSPASLHHPINGGIRWISQTSRVQPLVICGPSGSGKTTLLKYLMDEYGDNFGFSVSHTTRKPRPGEMNGREYHFVERFEMETAIKNGDFLEYTEFSGNLYGTSKKAVKDVQDQGRICILDIEIEGVKNIKKTDLNPRFVFIKPPSLKVLEDRLRNRGTETEENVQKRLARASLELAYGEEPGNFELVLINDNVEECYRSLKMFLLRDIDEVKQKRKKDQKGKSLTHAVKRESSLDTRGLCSIAHLGVLHAGSPRA